MLSVIKVSVIMLSAMAYTRDLANSCPVEIFCLKLIFGHSINNFTQERDIYDVVTISITTISIATLSKMLLGITILDNSQSA
jgi:hypothetical protein